MKSHVIAIIICGSLTASCADSHIYVMQDPKTGQVHECGSQEHEFTIFPIVQAHSENVAALDCMKGYQAAGWKRMN